MDILLTIFRTTHGSGCSTRHHHPHCADCHPAARHYRRTRLRKAQAACAAVSSQPGGEGQFQLHETDRQRPGTSLPKTVLSQSHPGGRSLTSFATSAPTASCVSEMLQHLLLALPYPIYLFILQPLVAPAGFLTGFLFETLMVMLSLSGLIAALDLLSRSPPNG